MPIHPLNTKDIKLNFVKKIQRLVIAWQKLNEGPYKHTQQMLTARASGFYDTGYKRTHTLNLIDRGVSTIVPFLVEGNPKVMVETKVASLRPWAYTTELALNFYIDKLKFAENILVPCAVNSMFGAGITKTTLIHDKSLTYGEDTYQLGVPSVQVIDNTNYIGDASAKSRQDFIIEGDIYRLPTEYAKEFFGKKFADLIVADQTLFEDYSPEEISKPDFDRNLLSIRDYSTFIDIYLADENIIITIMPDGKTTKILKTVEWDGPPGGPYDYLCYNHFPETPIPIPPAWAWYDKDVTVNILIEKMRQQAEAQKDFLAYEDGAEDDVARITKTPTNGTVRVNNLALIKDMHTGGVNPLNYEWVNFILNEFTKEGGNADVVGGRSAQAPTLGQEQMLMANATRIIYNMLTRFDAFDSSIVNKLAWNYWVNPTTYERVEKMIPGLGETLPSIFSDSGKVGDFYDYIFKVIPYSTQRTNPETKFRGMMELLTQWILPTLQLRAQQGISLDFATIDETLARYKDIDTFNQWYKGVLPQQLESIDYKMMPQGQQGGITELSSAAKTQNMYQQQSRAGSHPSPNQQTGQPND